jgi:hypothetical protein
VSGSPSPADPGPDRSSNAAIKMQFEESQEWSLARREALRVRQTRMRRIQIAMLTLFCIMLICLIVVVLTHG